MRQSDATFEEIVVPFHTEERGELIRKHSPSELVPVLTDGGLMARGCCSAGSGGGNAFRVRRLAVNPADEFLFPARRSRAERRGQRGRPAHRGRLGTSLDGGIGKCSSDGARCRKIRRDLISSLSGLIIACVPLVQDIIYRHRRIAGAHDRAHHRNTGRTRSAAR